MKLTHEVRELLDRVTKKASRTRTFLKMSERTVATAEALTGGMLGKEIAALPGGRIIYRGGVPCYSSEEPTPDNEVVAVTLEGSRAMAEGVRERSGATYGISTVGGNSADDSIPVGTFYISIATPEGTFSYTEEASGDRNMTRLVAVDRALNHLRSLLHAP